jgi:23S rRNA (cytidine1920-2'-O)/16S rRNA (cytidine1409-2'-O)-methyltransferase
MKKRADILAAEQGLAEDAAKAGILIMAGTIYADTKRIDKPGQLLADGTILRLKGREHPWVSRGGLKLVKGLDESGFDPSGLVCMDVGCSTGGFTDVLLSRGAAKVYAVDVGYGQLAQKLRNDPRVVVLERTNARHLTPEQIPEPMGMIVCDASFIGLRTVLPTPMSFAAPGAFLVALIKPQFEVPKRFLEKGVVHDPERHREVCAEMAEWLDAREGWSVRGIYQSPIKGPEGNIEFLLTAVRV